VIETEQKAAVVARNLKERTLVMDALAERRTCFGIKSKNRLRQQVIYAALGFLSRKNDYGLARIQHPSQARNLALFELIIY
jgi:hypothetical protein